MNTKSLEGYIADYNDILSKEESYQFFVRAQLAIPKLSKKNNNKLYLGFASFAIAHLTNLNEAESSIAILDVALNEYIKTHPSMGIDEHAAFVKTFIGYYKIIPGKCNKTNFKITFLQYCEKNKINEDIIKQNEVYLLFAIDNIKNGDKIIGYRFALRSEDYDTIIASLEAIGLLIQDKNEMDYFITRTLFELILLKNIPLAKKILLKYSPSIGSQFESSPPVLNFAFLLLAFLSNEGKTFENFFKFTNCYKTIIDSEKTFKQYLNMISKNYFNKPLSDNLSGGFSFFNILKSLTGS